MKRCSTTSVSRRGYTLLEISICLFIVAVLAGALLPSFSTWVSERKLRAPVGELKRMARQARMAAERDGVPCTIVIAPDSLRLELTPDSPPPRVETRALPPDTAVFTKTWREDVFVSRPKLYWHFHPGGLCDPLEIRFEQGKNWIELAFDPLTASPVEERYAFR